MTASCKVRCIGPDGRSALHEIRLTERGRLALCGHDRADLAAEARERLGGGVSRCIEVLRAWRAGVRRALPPNLRAWLEAGMGASCSTWRAGMRRSRSSRGASSYDSGASGYDAQPAHRGRRCGHRPSGPDARLRAGAGRPAQCEAACLTGARRAALGRRSRVPGHSHERRDGQRRFATRFARSAQVDRRMAARGLVYVGAAGQFAAVCALAGVRLTEAYGRTYAPAWAWAVWRLPPADYGAKVRRLVEIRRGGTAAKRAVLAEYALAVQAERAP